MTSHIFLCGHRKSGTTLLLDLLDGHPSLATYPMDANYMYGYFPTYTRGEFSSGERRARFDRVVFADLQEWLSSRDMTKVIDIAHMRDRFFGDIGERLDDICEITRVFSNAYRSAVKREQFPFVIKETSIEIYAQELAAGLPDAKFIQLIRDPRDNYAALKAGVQSYYSKFGENENATLASLLHRSRLGFQYAQINPALLGEDRYLTVRFEDLTQFPQETLEKVCSFLGISVTPSLFVPTVMGKSTKGNNFEGFDFSAVSTRNVGRWSERITEAEAAVIEFHFGPLMTHFGYVPHASTEVQAESAAEFYKWQNYKYYFSDRFAVPSNP